MAFRITPWGLAFATFSGSVSHHNPELLPMPTRDDDAGASRTRKLAMVRLLKGRVAHLVEAIYSFSGQELKAGHVMPLLEQANAKLDTVLREEWESG